MKVVGINGSGRKDGNTAILIRTVFEELEKESIETELVQLYNKDLQGCKACFACMRNKNQRCVQNDDLNEILEKMIQAEGIILGSPVYVGDVTAQIKALLDRVGFLSRGKESFFKHKVGASVVAERRDGGMHAIDTLNHFFLARETFLVGSTYWNAVYGRDKGDVTRDEEGMQNMRNLGQNMAWLMKRICDEQKPHI
jgi:multimeric flavodoxin WrbA